MIHEEKEVAKHYNKIKNLSIKERKESRNGQIRILQNEIKFNLLRLYIEEGNRVFDIGVGKGGDIKKYKALGISQLYGVDISPVTLFHCYTRILNENLDYRVILRNKNIFGESLNLGQQFDVVNSQFAFHYGFFSEEGLKQGIENINKLLLSNGYFIITVPSKKEILNRKKDSRLSNSFYKITFPNEWKDKPFNSCYTFFLEDSVDGCIEPLVSRDTLVSLLSEYKIYLHYEKSFKEFIYELKNVRLFEKWDNLSAEEKDVITLYEIFVFKKY